MGPGNDSHHMEVNKESLSEVNKQTGETEAVTEVLGSHAPAPKSLSFTVIKEMVQTFIRLEFTQTVAQKLVRDQGIYSLMTLPSLFDEDNIAICDVVGNLVA